MIQEMYVTPEMAEHWLAHGNIANRKMRRHRVDAYARMMAAGQWQFNGESISFDINNNLISGQHRLSAVVQSGATIRFLVVTGLDPGVRKTVDTGLKRGMSDLLHIEGYADTAQTAAVLNFMWRYEQGTWLHSGQPTANNDDLIDVMQRHPSLMASMAKVRGTKSFVSPTVANVMHYLMSQQDPELADAFWDSMNTGANLHIDDPIRRLRERLIMDRASKSRLQRYEIMALIIKAWNFYRRGERTKSLRWRNLEQGGEVFPTIE